MLKRFLAVLLSLAMILGCAAAETAAVPETETHSIEAKKFSSYASSPSSLIEGEEAPTLYFVDGVHDLPYMDVREFAELLANSFTGGGMNPGYELNATVDEIGKQVLLTRETEYSVLFDFGEGVIAFDDYNAVTGRDPLHYIDVAGTAAFLEEGKTPLLGITSSRDRYGEITILNLREYEIPMIAQDGKYLVPIQTLAAFFLYPIKAGFFFNGEALFMCPLSSMKNPISSIADMLHSNGMMTPEFEEEMKNFKGPVEEKTKMLLDYICGLEQGEKILAAYEAALQASLYPLYYSVAKIERSQALIDYSYRELCLEMDSYYGLKESHNITDFNTFFLQTGLYTRLMSPDPAAADEAVSDMTGYWFDDGHSGFGSRSALTDMEPETTYGFSSVGMINVHTDVMKIRSAYPNAALPYYEVGDTAFVTFDSFEITPDGGGLPDYYSLAEQGTLPNDTIGIIIRAHQEIFRENSPIRNVVIDLSCNGGGLAAAAAYMMCWCLGDAKLSIHDSFTKAQSTVSYRADVNMDHQHDEKDCLSGRGLNLYCLISPNSFSCGNLVPWALKENGGVTLLGRVSGGGSCVVKPVATAWGTTMSISGPHRISFTKNGSYYDVDRGVEPDYIIRSYEHFYDREALAEYLNGLF